MVKVLGYTFREMNWADRYWLGMSRGLIIGGIVVVICGITGM